MALCISLLIFQLLGVSATEVTCLSGVCESVTEKLDFEVVYWGIPWRGNCIRLILADAGVPFKDAVSKDVLALYKMPHDKQPTAGMAPPFIRHESFYINQMPAAVQYLAKILGYAPAGPKMAAVALKVLLDSNDCLNEISRGNGHQQWDGPAEENPKEGGDKYPAWRAFVDPKSTASYGARLPKWLAIFSNVGEKLGTLTASSGFMVGDRISYADIAVFNLIYMLDLLKMSDYVTKLAPLLRAHHTRMFDRPGIKKFLAAQRETMGDLSCGGDIQKSILKMVSLGIHTKAIE